MTAVVTSTEARLAAFHGQVFARNTYYTDGGSDAGISGAAWFLITEMARRAYEGDPEGRFVMGYLDPALHDESVGGGLVRSRRSMRVTSYPTAIVTLTSAPPVTGSRPVRSPGGVSSRCASAPRGSGRR
jgi:hypothetical protein